ncbi:MAG: FecR domain-containing protein [Alphaproteobacteria bacterium]|nr:FecR domain-containing protein [Alphaproteobacteria bacterium]
MAASTRLRQGLAAAVVALALGQPLHETLAQKVGVNSAVNPDATGAAPGADVRRLVLGQEVVHDEHIATGAAGQTQILFLDESAMSVGPSSDVTIDNFVYDPNTGGGRLAMSATKGVLRYVGGRLSKIENGVELRTPAGVIGVRGGVFLMTLTPRGALNVVFLYGKGLTIAGNCAAVTSCPPQTLTRPGFAVHIDGPGAAPSSPSPAPADAVAATLAQFNGKSGATGGSSTPPTDANVAASGIGNTISGNVTASAQQAAQNTPPATQARGIDVGAIQTTLRVNTVAATANPTVAQADAHPTPAGTPIGNQGSTPAGNQGIAISGGVKVVSAGSNTGFIDQSPSGRLTFSGQIRGGTATGTNSSGTVFTLTGLQPGQTSQVTGTASTAQVPATGTGYLAPDSRFFYANLTAQGASADRIFVFGGTPLDASFFASSPTAQITAFTVQPDFTLGGPGTQTIPFLPSFAGGTLANPAVSPLYVATQPGQPFGDFNPVTNPNGKSPFLLQASLAINGQGASQQSALSILTGSFATSTDNGQVVATGPYRATFLGGGTSPLTHVNAGFGSVPDANGNTLFGGTAIDGFVLDSNTYNANLNFQQQNANAFTIGPGSTQTPYAFNQPVTPGTLPAGVGVNRDALNEQGFLGGIMSNGQGTQYIVAGNTSVFTNPTNSTVTGTFVANDPFHATSGSNLQTIAIPFGASPTRNFARSAFIDNNIYAATESATVPVQLTNTSGTVTNYPTFAGGAATFPTAGFVTSGTFPTNPAAGLLPPGASFCACQYLQWGYWEANLPSIGQGGPTNTVQSSSINTWLAGQPTVTLPTTGVATYNGAAIGTVATNGANYLAAGAFQNVYNFASGTGTVAINNFDGRSYNAGVSIAPGNIYAGGLSQTAGPGNVSGSAVGGFFGPNAAETGGFFFLKNGSGPAYLASGVFAGKQ